MKPYSHEEKAFRMLKRERELLRTHDIGHEGGRVLDEIIDLLRRDLQPKIAWLVISAWLTILVALSANALAATRVPPVKPTPKAFDCTAYARKLLPWRGDPKSPVFKAANEAQLPDNHPEFSSRRKAACETLAAHSRGDLRP